MPISARTGNGHGELSARTRVRILDGAMLAIARHGLSKLGMSDVSESAGVSRGTLYRYFPTRDELLHHLAAHESLRFQERVGEALRAAPPGAERLRTALQYVARYIEEHPAIRRVLETEPAFVLRYLRAEFPALRATMGAFLAPLLAETRPVHDGVATAEQLADWLTRMMIAAVLLIDADPDGTARSLTAVYGLLTHPAAPTRAARPRRPAARRSDKGRR
ncbi:MAG: TetR/AcrR family transcriptional regulator [Candidatus Binatia bacterium]